MSIGSVDIYLDKPPEVSINDGGGEPFAVIELSPWPGRAYIALRTRAEADALVKAVLAARDLLPEPPGEPWFCGSCGTGFAGERPANGRCGGCQALASVNDIDNAGHATLRCAPGDCTCGAHVSADGSVSPASAR